MHAKNLKDYRLNQYQLYLFQNVELKKKDPSNIQVLIILGQFILKQGYNREDLYSLDDLYYYQYGTPSVVKGFISTIFCQMFKNFIGMRGMSKLMMSFLKKVITSNGISWRFNFPRHHD